MHLDKLAGILESEKSALVASWTDAIHGAGPGYASRPVEELSSAVTEMVEGIIQAARTGDYSRLFDHIAKAASARARMGFKLGEMQRVIMIGSALVVEAINRHSTSWSHAECLGTVNQVLEIMNWASITLGDQYSDAKEKEFSAAVLVAMTAAQSEMDEREVVRHSLQECCRLLGYERGAIVMKYHGRLDAQYPAAARKGHDVLRDVGAKIVLTGEKVELAGEEELSRLLGSRRSEGIRSVVGIPLLAHGQVTGALVLGTPTVRRATEHELLLAKAMGNQMVLARQSVADMKEARSRVEKVRGEQQELMTIMNELGAVVYVSDLNTYEILAVNRPTEEAFGKSLLGKKCYSVIQRGQTGPCPWCTNRFLVKDGVPTGPYSWKFRNTLNDRVYQCIDRALVWPDGRLARMEVAFDISELEETHLKLEEAKNMLELLNDLLVHDVRGYAGTAQSYLELLADSGARPAPEGSIPAAMDQIRKIDRLVENVAKMAKAQSSESGSCFPVEVCGLLDETIADADPDRKVKVLKGYGSEKRYVAAGEFGGDIFLNLLTNAVKYGDGKPVSVDVTESELRGKPAWAISVTDMGKGIPPEKRKLIFSRFARLDSLSKLKGVGLGLVLAKSLTESYGGELSVESRVPEDYTQGTRFSVVLPRAEP
jgi:signal transduction histidine kinase